jgi:hypothetical protein
MLAVVAALLPEPAWAHEKIVRQDTNEDGKIDQIAFFDKRGRIIKLEIDSNADELMDRFQYYEKEQIIRVERDRKGPGMKSCQTTPAGMRGLQIMTPMVFPVRAVMIWTETAGWMHFAVTAGEFFLMKKRIWIMMGCMRS